MKGQRLRVHHKSIAISRSSGNNGRACPENHIYLELLDMECGVEDPPVLDTLLALEACDAVAE
jgi:hypothetical protein